MINPSKFNLMKSILVLFLLIWSGKEISSQVLIADINQENKGSNPRELSAHGKDLAFAAEGNDGPAIFILEDSQEEPRELVKLREYGFGEFVFSGILTQNHYFFTTVSNGVRYVHVHDINQGETQIAHQEVGGSDALFMADEDNLYIHKRNSSYKQAIYRFNFSSKSFEIIFEFQNSGFWIDQMISYNGDLIYTQKDTNTDYHSLWRLDLTTFLPEKLTPADNSTWIWDFGVFDLNILDDRLYFMYYEEQTGYEIWQSDGTTAGTELFVDFDAGDGQGASHISVYDDHLYFVSSATSDGLNLYRTSGTVDNIEKITYNLEQYNISAIARYIVEGDDIYLAMINEEYGREIWKTNIDQGTTSMIGEVVPGPEDGIPSGFIWTIQNDLLFFTAETEEAGTELWISDGAPSNTRLIEDLYAGMEGSEISTLIPVGSKLYFDADDKAVGQELRRYDFEDEEIRLVSDINSSSSGSSWPSDFYQLNDKLIFSAFVDCIGRELFSTEGSALSTTLLNDFLKGKEFGPFFYLQELNGKLYFPITNTFGTYSAYWSTDGTMDGTSYAFDSAIGHEDDFQFISILGMLKDRLYALATVPEAEVGVALYSSNGSDEGTEFLKTIYTSVGTVSGSFLFYNLRDEVLIFEVSSNGLENGLWRTDGTAAGTFMLQGGDFSKFKVVDDNLYYLKRESATKRSFWKTDGTVNGITRISPDQAQFSVIDHIDLNGSIYFITEILGLVTMVKSDGTIDGIEDIESPIFNWVSDMVTLGDQVIISAETDDEGYELWVYDSVDNEWRQLVINPGIGNSNFVIEGTVFEDKFYFTANDGVHGDELWVTDGTPENTEMIMDLWPGENGSEPGPYTIYKDFIYFGADANDASGSELYKYSPHDKDNDGYLSEIDIDDNDPTVNVDDPNDPDDVLIFCIPEDPNAVIEKSFLKDKVTIYPNPTMDYLKIDLKSKGIFNLQLFSSEGQLILEKQEVQNHIELDLSILPRGLYKFRVLSKISGVERVWNVVVH